MAVECCTAALRYYDAPPRGAAGMLNLGNLNLYNEETCIGLPYIFEFLNLFTFIYLFNSDHRSTKQHKDTNRTTENRENYQLH